MEYLLAYGAGLLTLINPCVLPVLPIVLAGALQQHRHGPMALAAGMALSFVVLGVAVTAFGRALGLHEGNIAQAGAWAMIIFGVVMLVPRFRGAFASATSGMAGQADGQMTAVQDAGLGGQFLGGMLLGAVWSPCVGPTLGGAIALASQGQNLGHVTLIMAAFAAGIATLILALGYGTRSFLLSRRDVMRRIATVSQPLMGFVFIIVGTAILLKWHHIAEAWLLDHLPHWLIDFSVIL